MTINPFDPDKPSQAAVAATSNRSGAMTRLGYCSAWFMLINGALGLLVSIAMVLLHHSAAGLIDSPPYVSLLGTLAGLLAVRGALAGLVAGSVFYGLQILSFYSTDLQFNFRSGFSYGLVLNLPDGILVINVIAFIGLLVILWILTQRARGNGRTKAL